MSGPRRIGIAELEERIAVDRSNIWRWYTAGRFPKPHYLGTRRCWWLSEVVAWESANTRTDPLKAVGAAKIAKRPVHVFSQCEKRLAKENAARNSGAFANKLLAYSEVIGGYAYRRLGSIHNHHVDVLKYNEESECWAPTPLGMRCISLDGMARRHGVTTLNARAALAKMSVYQFKTQINRAKQALSVVIGTDR